ncbi:MAG: carboxypeptidase-like regulatory domain-containing protein, partial [Bryobacteraceae bacterium]
MKSIRIHPASFVLVLTLAANAFAQGNLGGVTGTIGDSSNAAVPEVKLTLTSTLTNSAFSATADSSGIYSFRGLPPGLYRLDAEKQGFKKYVQENVSVLTATVTTLDIQLSVGAVSESITVSSAGVALQTTTPEVSTVLERRAILDLPIQVGGAGATTAASGRRQPENFIFLTPGVSG